MAQVFCSCLLSGLEEGFTGHAPGDPWLEAIVGREAGALDPIRSLTYVVSPPQDGLCVWRVAKDYEVYSGLLSEALSSTRELVISSLNEKGSLVLEYILWL